MEYLKHKLRYFGSIFVTRPKENKEKEVSRREVYFDHVFKILGWEDITITLVVFLVLNLIYWIIVYWQMKFFGIVFFAILLGFLWDSYFEARHSTLYQGKYLDALDEMSHFFCDIVLNLKALRKESPSSFCIAMSIIFLLMSFIARNVSGYVLVYLMLLGIFFIPLGLKFVPEEYMANLKQIFRSVGTTKGVLAEEELIPFISNKDFTRKDTDLDSLLTDRTAGIDSATNSFLSGISAMPSYLDVAETQDVIEEDDLIPNRGNRGVSFTPGELSSDSDSDHQIHFDSSHFNGDTSSEEENLSKGLLFSTDNPEVPKTETVFDAGFSGVLSNITTMGSNLMANVLKTAISNAPIQRKDSSSDSEFEIINSEEIGNK